MTTAVRGADLRPLGAGWTAVLALAGALALGFGVLTGRSALFGSTAWTAISLAPVLLGAGLAVTSTADRGQYVARGLAASLMAPIGLAMWAGTADAPAADGVLAWVAGLGALMLQLLAWLVLLAWTARRATRLMPAAGSAPVDAERLQRRMAALAAGGGPLSLNEAGALHAEFELDVDPRGERCHLVALRLDPARREVRVTERLAARGAAPLADEARFRRPGDPLLDASRPPVQRVSGRVRQATLLDATALADWPLGLQGDTVEGAGQRPAAWAGADAEGRGRLALAAIAAVVLGSGWTWQPLLVSGRTSRGAASPPPAA